MRPLQPRCQDDGCPLAVVAGGGGLLTFKLINRGIQIVQKMVRPSIYIEIWFLVSISNQD
jgi:hypothetical protein